MESLEANTSVKIIVSFKANTNYGHSTTRTHKTTSIYLWCTSSIAIIGFQSCLFLTTAYSKVLRLIFQKTLK